MIDCIFPLSSKVLAYPPSYIYILYVYLSERLPDPGLSRHPACPQRSSSSPTIICWDAVHQGSTGVGRQVSSQIFPHGPFFGTFLHVAPPGNRWCLYVFVVFTDFCWFLNKPEIWCATSKTFQKNTMPLGFNPQQKTGGHKPSKNREPRDASPWFRWSHCISNKYKAEFCVGLIWKKKRWQKAYTPKV